MEYMFPSLRMILVLLQEPDLSNNGFADLDKLGKMVVYITKRIIEHLDRLVKKKRSR